MNGKLNAIRFAKQCATRNAVVGYVLHTLGLSNDDLMAFLFHPFKQCKQVAVG